MSPAPRPHRRLRLRASLALLAALSLMSCQTTAPPSEEEIVVMARALPGRAEILRRFEEVARYYRDICLAPDYARYFGKSPCLPEQASAGQLSDRSRVTPEEARQLARLSAEVDELNRESQDLMLASGIEEYVARAERARRLIDPEARRNRRRLLDGEIDWGEYNRRRLELQALARDGEEEGRDGAAP